MNTLEIEKTVGKDSCLNKYFLGVFACDQLPRVEHYPTCFIANTHPSDKPGEHWIAMFFDVENVVEYFDSYGLKPKSEFKTYKPNQVNPYCLQDIDSVVCGEYCIFYLHKRVRGVTMTRITDDLRRRANADNFVRNYINKMRVRTPAVCGQSCRCLGDNENC